MKSIKSVGYQNPWFIVGLIILCSYFFLIVLSPPRLLYDEIYYIAIAKNLALYGLSIKFISAMDAPTGILYALVHWLFSPFTQYQAPSIRIVNFILGCGSGFLLAKIYCKINSNNLEKRCHSSYLAITAIWLAAPVSGVILCLALTEMSGIFFSLLGTLCVTNAILDSNRKNFSILYLIMGGVSYGLSIWGRQNFIILPVLSILLLLPLNWSRFRQYLIIIASSLPFFIAPIIIWGGLVPPAVDFVSKGILPSSLAFSFYYVSASIGLTCPSIYFLTTKRRFLISLLLSSATIVIFPSLILIPSKFLLQRIVGDVGANLIGICLSIALLTLSAMTVIILINIVKQRPHERFSIVFLGSGFTILASNIMIAHQFSSRYVTLTLPYIILAIYLRKDDQLNLSFTRILLLTISLFLSLLFVLHYYQA